MQPNDSITVTWRSSLVEKGFKNKSFMTNFTPPKEEFDLDIFMAIQALDSPENIKKIKESGN